MFEHIGMVLQTPDAVVFVVVYTLCLLAVAGINSYEFKRSPEKGKRYRSLPIGYKLACWFVVVPLFAAVALETAFFIPAIVAFLCLEAVCVRWYRKARML
jgi:uncharacterized membrane protein YidH (DUF202 family)